VQPEKVVDALTLFDRQADGDVVLVIELPIRADLGTEDAGLEEIPDDRGVDSKQHRPAPIDPEGELGSRGLVIAAQVDQAGHVADQLSGLLAELLKLLEVLPDDADRDGGTGGRAFLLLLDLDLRAGDVGQGLPNVGDGLGGGARAILVIMEGERHTAEVPTDATATERVPAAPGTHVGDDVFEVGGEGRQAALDLARQPVGLVNVGALWEANADVSAIGIEIGKQLNPVAMLGVVQTDSDQQQQRQHQRGEAMLQSGLEHAAVGADNPALR
jgi:hypothetical protein